MQLYSLKPKFSFYLAAVVQINVIMAMLPTKYCKDSTSLLKFRWLPFVLVSLTLGVRTDNGEPKINSHLKDQMTSSFHLVCKKELIRCITDIQQ